MFIIDITLKNTPVSLSVQRKTVEDAEAVYQKIVQAITSDARQLVEVTCEHQAGKKITLLSSEISAVQVAEKSSTATSSGRPPGFAALVE